MKNLWKTYSKGIITENPILVLALSLCPALATTTTAASALTMGLTVTFVIATNNTVVSLTRNWVNAKVRVPVYIISIATIVTMAELLLKAYMPTMYKQLGIYLNLVVVFAIILARAEVFASKNKVLPSFLDGFGMGCGFTLSMVLIGVIRELLGNGSIFGVSVFGAGYQPALVMVMAPGAFILIGYLVAATRLFNQWLEKHRALEVSEK